MTDLTERLRQRIKNESSCGNRTGYPLNRINLMDEAATTLETLTQENARLREALEEARRVLFERIPRLGPEGPDSLEQQHEYEEVGGAWSMADRVLNARKALGGGDGQ